MFEADIAQGDVPTFTTPAKHAAFLNKKRENVRVVGERKDEGKGTLCTGCCLPVQVLVQVEALAWPGQLEFGI